MPSLASLASPASEHLRGGETGIAWRVALPLPARRHSTTAWVNGVVSMGWTRV